MNWLAHPSWQGVMAIATIVALVPIIRGLKQQHNHAKVVVERLVFLFKSHGIDRTKIPRFLGEEFGLTVDDVSTDEKLLRKLNDQILADICDRLGVRRGWLEGDSGPIYDLLYHYKNIDEFVSFVKELRVRHPEEVCFLEAYKPDNTSADLYKSHPDISLVFAEPIAELDQRTIYRYYPLSGPFPWGHMPARLNIYAFFTLAFTSPGIVLKGYDVQSKFISELAEGKVMPENVKTEGIWHPDDYAFSSVVRNLPMHSKEVDIFWNYIKEKGLLGYFDKNIYTRPDSP